MGVTQSIMERPILDHFLILLEVGGARRGPSPIRFENTWLKIDGFKGTLK